MNKYKTLLEGFTAFHHPNHAEQWADLGCGSGVFTEVLANVLPAKSNIVAIDSKTQYLPHAMGNAVSVRFQKNNFETDDLNLPALDGIMMANALHYISSKESLILKLERCFQDNPLFVMVEYEKSQPNAWVPFPIPYANMKALFQQLGYKTIKKLGEQKSVYGEMMYACLIFKN